MNNEMVKINHCELKKCTLVGRVDKFLNQSLSNKTSKVVDDGYMDLALNPKDMDDKTKQNNIYFRNLGLGLTKVWAKHETQESHFMFLGVQESVRE
jgi:hypothetical protein